MAGLGLVFRGSYFTGLVLGDCLSVLGSGPGLYGLASAPLLASRATPYAESRRVSGFRF